MARLPTDSGDDGAWGDILNTFLKITLATDGYVRNGSQAAPGIAFSDGATPDVDTGLRHPGPDRVMIVTSGMDRWEVNTVGDFLASSFGGGLAVNSYMQGNDSMRGIARITGGTSVVSVSASAVRSGDVILATPYMYVDVQNSGQGIVPNIESVRAGAFEIRTGENIAPTSDMDVAWFVMR